MERFKKFSAIFTIMAGIIVRLHSEPTAAAFLIASEFVTAIFLLAGGIGILTIAAAKRLIFY
jgi:hypothetical protein